MANSFDARRHLLGAARRYFLDERPAAALASTDVPRLTPAALEKHRMSRARERILANLDDMYREAFERAKSTEDEAGMKALDFSYRREQLYFEILLDMRDAIERR